MYTKSNGAAPDLQQELSHGEAMNKELYRKNLAYLGWFKNMLFGRMGQGRTPQGVVEQLGNSAVAWFRAAQNSADFVASAHATDNSSAPNPSVMIDGWKYEIAGDKVNLIDLKSMPAIAARTAEPVAV